MPLPTTHFHFLSALCLLDDTFISKPYLSYTNHSENEKTHLQRKCAGSIYGNEGGRLIIGFATAMTVFLRLDVTD